MWVASPLLLGVLLQVAACRHPVGPEPAERWPAPPAWTAPTPHHGPVGADWVDDLQDARLSALISRALDGNPGFEAAAARLEAAAETARIAGAERWPHLAGGLDGSRRVTEMEVGDLTDDRFTGSLTVSWEIDYLGRLRDRSRAAEADLGAALDAFLALRLTLAANVARGWFDLLEAEAQRSLAEETLRSFESNLAVIEQQFESGLSTALEVRLLRANAASARAALATRSRNRDAAARLLEVLVGDYPAGELSGADELPAVLPPPPPGLPSELLLRRPDLRAAEWELEAASLRAAEARKALFPSLRLTSATVGTSSDELSSLLQEGTGFRAFAGGLTAPLFRGGALRAASARARALAEAAVADYQQRMLTAFREVESALAADAFLGAQVDALTVAAQESAEAETLAWERYQRGLVDIVTVLESQRRAFSSRQSLLSARNDRWRNRVALHLALGGGFSPDRPPSLASIEP